MPARKKLEQLFAKRWVHVFEEDQKDGNVYRPEDGPVPLSRRPRERLVLHRDGSASLFLPGADDRMVERPASWTDEEGVLVVQPKEDPAELRIIDISEDRLLVAISFKTSSRNPA